MLTEAAAPEHGPAAFFVRTASRCVALPDSIPWREIHPELSPMLTPRPHLSRSTQPTPHATSGFGLVEALIVAAAVSLLTVGLFTFYGSVSAKSKAQETTQAVLQLTQSIHKAYVASANFAGVTNATVVEEHLLPSGLETSGPLSGPEIVAPYGGTLSVASATVDGIPNRGYGLTLNTVPKKLCSQIVAGLSSGNFRNITINENSVVNAQGLIQPNLVAQFCGEKGEATIALTITDKQTDAALELRSCSAPSPSTETEVEACPAGYVGAITRKRSAACPPGSLLAEWGPWTETNTCEIACVPAPSSPQTRTTTPCPDGYLGTITEMRVSACATGQIAGYPSWSEWTEVSNTCAPVCVTPADQTKPGTCPAGEVGTVTLRRSASCPQPTGTHVWGEWEEIANNCRPACIAPEDEQRTVNRTASCAAGRITPAGATSFTQSQTITKHYVCAAGATTPTWSESASEWSPAESVACQQACIAPASHIETRTSTPCPTGQTGVIEEIRTTSYTCQTPTGSPVESVSDWSEVSNSCKNICILPSPSTQTETSEPRIAYWNKPIVCWWGWSGSEQNSSINMRRDEVRTRTRNASCSTGQVAWSDWSDWSEYTAISDWIANGDPCPGRHKCIPSNEYVTESRTSQCPSPRLHNGSKTYIQTRSTIRRNLCPSNNYGDPIPYLEPWGEWLPRESSACL